MANEVQSLLEKAMLPIQRKYKIEKLFNRWKYWRKKGWRGKEEANQKHTAEVEAYASQVILKESYSSTEKYDYSESSLSAESIIDLIKKFYSNAVSTKGCLDPLQLKVDLNRTGRTDRTVSFVVAQTAKSMPHITLTKYLLLQYILHAS